MKISDIINKDEISFEKKSLNFFIRLDLKRLQKEFHKDNVIAFWWNKKRKEKLVMTSIGKKVLFWGFFHDKCLDEYYVMLVKNKFEGIRILTKGVVFGDGRAGKPSNFHLTVVDSKKFEKVKANALTDLL